jgi:glucuronate isomerase
MQTPFIHDDFLLQTEFARRLYHEYAADQPIFDYHCHLPPDEIAADRRFADAYDIWLRGDHYKWRAMRTNGMAERFCTGDASPREKFQAWAETVPHTLRNPLFHWTALELKRYFGIGELLGPDNAERVWTAMNERLATPELSVHGILNANKVRVVCTTDDPADTLEHHRAIRENPGRLKTRVYPTFRPDKALWVDRPEVWNAWRTQLGKVCDAEIDTLPGLMEALKARHDYFHSLGGRLSDHGMSFALGDPCTGAEAARIFDRALAGQVATPQETAGFGAFMMIYFGQLDAEKGWTKQLHLGALRNNNSRLFKALGPDTGFDSIGDWPQAEGLSRYLDRLDRTNQLPRIILYNLNPADNYVYGTMIGNFQDGSIAGKVQFGSGWWFNDQKDGMEAQINALSNLGLLSRFVGMLTDSRSFLSFPRHEYFRRILCNLLGNDVKDGLLPGDLRWIGGLVRDVCYGNAERYFGLETGE